MVKFSAAAILADDPLQALHDGLGGLLFLARQILLVAHVRLLNLADPLLQLSLFLANRLGGAAGCASCSSPRWPS